MRAGKCVCSFSSINRNLIFRIPHPRMRHATEWGFEQTAYQEPGPTVARKNLVITIAQTPSPAYDTLSQPS